MRIRISIPNQELTLFNEENDVVSVFPISTSKFGVGFEVDSYKTPTGNFEICEKIGAGQPEGMIFERRFPTGKIAGLDDDEALITTRILRLKGLDDENKNTFDRCIYIHGGNKTDDWVGKIPRSHGCVRMKNKDIVELFNSVPIGTEVVVEN